MTNVSSKAEALTALLADMPATRAICDAVLAAWPEHAAYLVKSMEARDQAQRAATELAAAATLTLAGEALPRCVAGYRWTCDRLRDEELFFHRHGRYRLSTFAEADAEVYSNADYMTPYVDGLLLSQVLWFNHAATFAMFMDDVLGRQDAPFDYLEIGPGHGLMVAQAGAHAKVRSAEAWDVSAVSLRETAHALKVMGVTMPVSLTQVDILAAAAPPRTYDLIVISEVLEHLERPDVALAMLRRALAPGGRIFINVPINSPSPDHIYLLETPEQVAALIEGAGLAVETMRLFATQGRAIDKALANKVTISAGVIARAA